MQRAEAQKPKTFRVATFNAQKLPDEVRETVSNDKPKKRAFASHDIANECVIIVCIWKNPDTFDIIQKISGHLEKSGQL